MLMTRIDVELKRARNLIAEAMETHIYDKANGEKPAPDCEYAAALVSLDVLIKEIGAQPTPEIYVSVKGGIVQCVRATTQASVKVIDYDNIEGGEENPKTGEFFKSNAEYEKHKLGCTWKKLKANTVAVY